MTRLAPRYESTGALCASTYFIFTDKDRGEIRSAPGLQGQAASDAYFGLFPGLDGRRNDLTLGIPEVFRKIGIPAEPVFGKRIRAMGLEHPFKVQGLELAQSFPIYGKGLSLRQEQPNEVIGRVADPDDPLLPKEQADAAGRMPRKMDDLQDPSAQVEQVALCHADHGGTPSVKMDLPVEILRHFGGGQFFAADLGRIMQAAKLHISRVDVNFRELPVPTGVIQMSVGIDHV